MQFEWSSKDSVSFDIYKEVVESKTAQFLIWLESDNKEISLIDFRTGGNKYRFNNFVIKENVDNNTITFCPNIAGCPAYFRIKSGESFHMTITRKDGSSGGESTFREGETKLELTPVGMRMYKVNVDGTLSSGQNNTIGVKKEEPNEQQEESIPEFFGGSFSSISEQAANSPSVESPDVIDNPIDDANIFTGGFNSENESVAGQKVETVPRKTDASTISTENSSGNTIPLFADMFQIAGGMQEKTLGQRTTENRKPTEEVKEQPVEQGESSFSSAINFRQNHSAQISGEAPGFSVPYVETEGVRERKSKIKKLQQSNDRTAREVDELKSQIAELESRSRKLSDKKSSLISHLEVLQDEYDKDYLKYQTDIEDIKGRYTVDQSILEFYKDKDLVPIEDLLKQTDELVRKVEGQIRLFVTAQQNKTDEIEKTLKVGKRE